MEPVQLSEDQIHTLKKFDELSDDQKAEFIMKAMTYYSLPLPRPKVEDPKPDPQCEEEATQQ